MRVHVRFSYAFRSNVMDVCFSHVPTGMALGLAVVNSQLVRRYTPFPTRRSLCFPVCSQMLVLSLGSLGPTSDSAISATLAPEVFLPPLPIYLC